MFEAGMYHREQSFRSELVCRFFWVKNLIIKVRVKIGEVETQIIDESSKKEEWVNRVT